jgi:hypothetical protein
MADGIDVAQRIAGIRRCLKKKNSQQTEKQGNTF